MKKIVVLGAKGMAGHVIDNFLSKIQRYDVYKTIRDVDFAPSNRIFQVDVFDRDKLIDILLQLKPDIVINCIGVLVNDSLQNKDLAIYINSYLPHFLARLCDQFGAKFIHISTDCVFSGKKGGYTEDDICDASSHYGKTKALGEIKQSKHLTIRTSIIGPELKSNGTGLFNWFMQQQFKTCGYTKSLWSGVTTIELAKAIDWTIEYDIKGLYHLTNGASISKYELLLLFNKYTERNVSINPVDGVVTNKTLTDNRKGINYSIPSYEEMIKQMIIYINSNKTLYNHYVKEELCVS